MPCPASASGNQSEFPAEMIVHPRGLKNLDNPGVRIFQKLSVCLDCGYSWFTVPEAELLMLAAPPPPTKRRVMAAD
jgi:hypothetical protein